MNDFFPPTADAIAVVGAACRLPGGTHDLDAFWQVLIEARDVVTPAPAGRFDQSRFLADVTGRPGKTYSFAGGYLDDIAAWDADYFGVSPREASRMDPQQRLLLEMAVEVIDDAGMDPADLDGSDTGVYIGLYSIGYGILQMHGSETIDVHNQTGTTGTAVANRLSYYFNLHGPSMAVDTACSSSLIALHQACETLRSGQSRLALAGGINALINPQEFVVAAKARTLSRRGRCQAFSAQADGFARAEGGGLVLLKRLSDALVDGDRVHGVILASGTNCDGRTAGLAHPNSVAQEALLRQLYERAGVRPEEVAYVEAHGTGTQAGDLAECTAIGRALGVHRPSGRALPIGSVKTNVGHLESAAGITGLLKALLVLRHGVVPPSLHADTLNPAIDFEGLRIDPVRRPRPVTSATATGRTVVGVNSFGIGGANAHIVLAAPARQPAPARTYPGPGALLPVVVSGRTPEAARRSAERMAARLEGLTGQGDHNAAGGEPDAFYDLAHTACRRRGHREHRVATFARSASEAARRLRAVAGGAADAVAASAASVSGGKTAFVFSGNGSQWAGMGAGLLADDAVFRAAVEEIDALLLPKLGWSVAQEMRAPSSGRGMERTEVAQPLLFAVQAGLVRMLERRGIRPAAVIGHSVGEVAAACTAGAYDLPTAAHVVAERSLLQGTTAGTGRMAAVGLSPESAEKEVNAFRGLLEIAGVNSASDVTLSGDPAALAELGERLRPRGVFFRMLDLDYGFHSRAMNPIEHPLLDALASVKSLPTAVPMVSTVTGRAVRAGELDASYWWRNVREPVLFAPAVRQLAAEGCEVFVEIGPRPVLAGYVRRLVGTGNTLAAVVPTLSPPEKSHTESEPAAVDAAAAQIVAAGAEIDWHTLFPVPGRVVDLPAYAWQRERHWNGEPEWWSPKPGSGRIEHPLLGERVPVLEPTWHARVEPVRLPWLPDHRVDGAVVMPAAAYVEMALAAGRLALGAPVEMTALDGLRALVLPWEDPRMAVTVQVSVSEEDGHVRVAGRADAGSEWQVHARCQVRELLRDAPADRDLAAVRERLRDARVGAEEHYARLSATGVYHGPDFQAVREIHLGEAEALARYAAPVAMDGFEVHPVLLDGALQVGSAVVPAEDGAMYLPSGIDAVRVWRRAPASGLVHARLRSSTRDEAVFDVAVMDERGAVALEVHGCRVRRVATAVGEPARYTTVMRAAPRPSAHVAASTLPDPAELVESARRHARTSPADARGPVAAPLDAYERRARTFTAHCTARALNGIVADGEPFGVADVIAAGVLPRYRRLVTLLASTAEAEGLLERAGGTGSEPLWRFAAEAVPEAVFSTLGEEFPQEAPTLALFGRCGLHLGPVLCGQADALDLIMAEADPYLVEKYYSTDSRLRAANLKLADTLAVIVRQWPADRPLRVLELGGGTGSATAELLPCLPPERTQYVFTDLSPTLMHRAQKRLGAYGFVEYRALDLERDPCEQRFATGEFDLVVASNVLHATSDLSRTLGHVGSLLAEGGHLLALESNETDELILCFGLLDGFWAFEDTALRDNSPLLPAEKWLSLLRTCGFEEPAVFGDGNEPARTSVLVARLAAGEATRRTPAAPPVAEHRAERWLVAAEEASTDLARDVCAGLTDGGGVAHLTELSDHAGDWASLLSDSPESAHVVLLLDDRDPGPKEPGQNVLRRSVAATAVLRAVATAVEGLAGVAGPALWIVTPPSGALPAPETPGAPAGAVPWGVARVLAEEHPRVRLRKVSLSRSGDTTSDAARLVAELTGAGEEDEIALSEGGRYVPRVVPLRPSPEPPAPGTPYGLRLHRQGPAHRLAWAERQPAVPGPDEVVVAVRAACLDPRDMLQADGTVPPFSPGEPDHPTGLDCAGVVTAVGPGVTSVAPGDRVFALAPGACASEVVAKAALVARMPETMSFPAAATLPSAFLGVHHALSQAACPEAGDTLLVHDATSGVGLAAVQYARRAGIRTILLARTPAQRDVLRLMGAEHVLNTDDPLLVDQVREVTGDRGADVVLCPPGGGDRTRFTAELLAPDGWLIDLGAREPLAGHRRVPAQRSHSYVTADLLRLIARRPGTAARLFTEIAGHIADEAYRPLLHVTEPATAAREAHRAVTDVRGLGRSVLTFDRTPPVDHRPRAISFAAEGTYLITGGLSGLGAATARWMAQRGARNLALVSRRGRKSPEAPALLDDLRDQGARASVYAADVSDRAAMADIITTLDSDGRPVRGIVHAAMHIDDAPLVELADDRVRAVLAPKMLGAHILDELTQDRELDLFVVYSSLAALAANPQQAAYTGANLYLEALVRRRRASGRPGLAVGWGPISGTGYVAREDLGDSMTRRGLRHLDAEQACGVLEDLLSRGTDVAAVADIDWKRLAELSTGNDERPLFRDVMPDARNAERHDADSADLQLLATGTREEATRALENLLTGTVARILQSDPEALDRTRRLDHLGVDSLMATELMVAIRRDLSCDVALVEVTSSPGVSALAARLLPRLRPDAEAPLT
ncbi:SDR family NAD(P)-dependent oxidoreductase [Streptomyces sp. NPDC102274]|uniref:SDR family NAD(P)-dependent oxidoreductase n=1 Tax=Streptomyces sp. NPDC102274 TaxID=3366151 RepID=UPI0038206F89